MAKENANRVGKERVARRHASCRQAGTPDPVSYVEAVLRKYPVPPDPGTLSCGVASQNAGSDQDQEWTRWGPAAGQARLPCAA